MQSNLPVHTKTLLQEDDNYSTRSYTHHYNQWSRYRSIRGAFYRRLKKLPPDKRIKVLDVGCGTGWIPRRLKKEFAGPYKLTILAIDNSKSFIDFAREINKYFYDRVLDFLAMDAASMAFNNEKFDIIVCSELIEHIPEPIVVITELYRILKKGGLIIMTTPNKGSGLLARFLRLIGGRHRNAARPANILDNTAENTHISVRSKREWERIFIKKGLKIVSVKGTSGLLYGSPYLDRYRILFAIAVIIESILEKLPFSYLWSETLFFELKK